MDVATTVADVRAQVGAWRAAGERVVLVPTMGNLHAGHISLVEVGHTRGERIVVSVFVNPTQFGPGEDFAAYPRTPDQDARMLREAGCHLLFQPDVGEMYPSSQGTSTRIEVPGLSSILCGAFRPGHFSGVATVVAKLIHIVEPDMAIFGRKDFQQLVVIRRMVADLRLRVEIVGAPTVREPDGLAMSSRNQYLTAGERRAAPGLYRELTRIADAIATGRREYAGLENEAVSALGALGFRPDFVSVRTADALELPSADSTELVVLAAARLGGARLIDNVEVRAGTHRGE